MSRCDHCPRAGKPCEGESWPRLCELVDASGPDYHPEYLDALEPIKPPESHPPLLTQAGNLARALVDAAADGFAKVDDAEYRRRKAICESCPSRKYDAAADRCRLCGCHLKVKRRLASQHCPDGHW